MSCSVIAYSTKEVRRRLGNIGHTKLYELFGSGQLKARKIAGRTVVLDPDLAEYQAGLPLATETGAIRKTGGKRGLLSPGLES